MAPWVTGDAGRIRQILANLVSNAIKFTEAGHVIVRLRAVDQPNGNQLLTLQVVDTGIGIGAQEQSQLFLPFYQIDSASHTVRGTGLGLSICARLAKLMNSWIRVTSELGLGSSFSMALAQARGGSAPTTPDLAGARVHVRSPHRELSEQVCLWLTMWGARHASAACSRRRRPSPTRLLDVLRSEDGPPSDWGGRYLRAREPGVRGEYGPDALDGHRLDSIGFGIQALLRGDRATPSAEPAEPEFQALGLRVLVAEDNPINQATLRNQLEQLGCTVTVASDGADALSLWPLTQYDALLTDVNMPKLNGYELASALRPGRRHTDHRRDRQCHARRRGTLHGGRHELVDGQAHRVAYAAPTPARRGQGPHARHQSRTQARHDDAPACSPLAPASAPRQVQASAPATEAPQVPAVPRVVPRHHEHRPRQDRRRARAAGRAGGSCRPCTGCAARW